MTRYKNTDMKYGVEAWFEMVRPLNILMTGIGVAIGYFLAIKNFPINESLGLAMLSAMLIGAAGMIINDYFDRYIDARIKPHRPIPSGRVKSNAALVMSLGLFAVGVYLASTINASTMYIASIASILLILYSWVFARLPLLGNAVVALNTGLTFIFGEAAATGAVFSVNTTILFILAFLSTLAREIYKDVEDVEGDKIARKTLPIIIGKTPSLIFASIMSLLAVSFSVIPLYMKTLGVGYLIGVGIADAMFLYISIFSVVKRKVYSKELKIAQFIALISFLLGV